MPRVTAPYLPRDSLGIQRSCDFGCTNQAYTVTQRYQNVSRAMNISGLQRVSLAYQELTEIPEKLISQHGKQIKELDLSHNTIQNFNFLLDLPSLETLILDHNGLHSHVKFPTLPGLNTLWINHNNISNLGVLVSTLSQCFPNLRYLSMMNNVAAPSYFNGGSYMQYTDYRYYVISQLPKLKSLDDKQITPEERAEAERIYTKVVYRKQSVNTNRRENS